MGLVPCRASARSRFGEDERHAVVDLPDKVIRGHGDDGKGANPLTALRLTPVLPNSGNGERCPVLHGNGVRLLRSRSFDGPPLKEAFDWNDAAPFSVSRAEARQGRQGFGARVDRLASAVRVLAPIRNQSPT